MHRNLGQLAIYQDAWDTARRHFDAAAEAFTEVGDRLGEGVTAVGLGTWLRERGERDAGLLQYQKAIEAFVEVGYANGEALAHSAAANVYLVRGDLVNARKSLAQAFLIAVRRTDAHREAKIRRRIAALRVVEARHDEAVRQLQKALAIFDGMGDDHCAAYTLALLGRAQMERGEVAASRKTLLDAIDVGHRLGDRSVEGQAAQCLGELYLSTGSLDNARRTLERAARVWQQAGNDEAAAECRGKLAESDPGAAAG
jgi:tetratricopeptide (TPR) repeat protein